MPMKLHFLKASVPLTKRFSLVNKQVEKQPYPNVYEVTSFDENVTNLADLEKALKKHSLLNHCLLKGQLNRPLMSESRAGSTDTNDTTQFLVLDVDGLPAVYQEPDVELPPDSKGVKRVVQGAQHTVTVDWLLEQLGLKGYSYIVQWSASYLIENDALRCHIFMLLDKPYPAPLLKQWLMDKNLSTPALTAALSLTSTGNALKWPLDVSACQNDKLIYIAPPTLRGIADPMKQKARTIQRIALEKRSKEKLSLDMAKVSTAKNKDAMIKQIDRLRAIDGLPKRKTTMKQHGALEVLAKPDTCIITDMKQERGFVYFNLNGGDSWGYFHPENSPDYIYNFKGEPAYLTKELLPEYWEQLHKEAGKPKVDSQGVLRLVFRERRSNRYYCGTYNTATRDLDLEPTDRTAALDHCRANGIVLRSEVIPDDWTITYDPQVGDGDHRVDINEKIVNTFQPTIYMNDDAKVHSKAPKTIEKVIRHMLGGDDEVYNHFINWLSWVVQGRDRAQTAWVIHGTTGTGKGTFLSRILVPMLGAKNVSVPRMSEFEKEFNSFVENKLIIAVDEIEVDALRNESAIMSDIRRYITEEYVQLRRMRSDAKPTRNYASLLFFSNSLAPVRLPRNDRRYNVSAFQAEKLKLTKSERERIDSLVEVQHFYDYLALYPCDQDRVLAPLENDERARLMELTETSMDAACNAILEGNLSYFIDALPTDNRLMGDADYRARADDFRNCLRDLIERTDRNTGVCNVERDELRALFEHAVGGTSDNPYKFNNQIKHHGLRIDKVWSKTKAKSVNGVRVVWREVADAKVWKEYTALFAPKPVVKPKAQLAVVK
jgi:hypothetical protein